jgi:Protein of unknown function (DUF1367)
MEVWAKVSESKHLVPDQPADVEKLRDFAPGSLVKINVKRPRRRKPHSMFFAAIARAFENWPELHEFQPENPEHLRAWLLVKAGYRSIFGESMNRLNNNPMRMLEFVKSAMERQRSAGGYSFVTEHRGSIVQIVPESIAFSELDEDQFRPLRDAVYQLIEHHTGIPVVALKKEEIS